MSVPESMPALQQRASASNADRSAWQCGASVGHMMPHVLYSDRKHILSPARSAPSLPTVSANPVELGRAAYQALWNDIRTLSEQVAVLWRKHLVLDAQQGQEVAQEVLTLHEQRFNSQRRDLEQRMQEGCKEVEDKLRSGFVHLENLVQNLNTQGSMHADCLRALEAMLNERLADSDQRHRSLETTVHDKHRSLESSQFSQTNEANSSNIERLTSALQSQDKDSNLSSVAVQLGTDRRRWEDLQGGHVEYLERFDSQIRKDLLKLATDQSNSESTMQDLTSAFAKHKDAERLERVRLEESFQVAYKDMERLIKKEVACVAHELEHSHSKYRDAVVEHKHETKALLLSTRGELDSELRKEIARAACESSAKQWRMQQDLDSFRDNVSKTMESERAIHEERRSFVQVAVTDLEAQVRREFARLTTEQANTLASLKEMVSEQRLVLERSLSAERSHRDELCKGLLQSAEATDRDMQKKFQHACDTQRDLKSKMMWTLDERLREQASKVQVCLAMVEEETQLAIGRALEEHNARLVSVQSHSEELEASMRREVYRLLEDHTAKHNAALQSAIGAAYQGVSLDWHEMKRHFHEFLRQDAEVQRCFQYSLEPWRQGLEPKRRMKLSQSEGSLGSPLGDQVLPSTTLGDSSSLELQWATASMVVASPSVPHQFSQAYGQLRRPP